jgi:hypothetical protein
MFGAPDDYTSTLSGMTVHVMNSVPLRDIAFVQERMCSVPSMDDDEDASVSEIIQSVVLGIHAKKNKLPNVSNGVVTSLSCDHRDGTTSRFRQRTSKGDLIRLPNEDDEARDASCDPNTNVMAHVEIVTPESGSVASIASLENANDGSDDPPSHKRNGSFLAFRLNYLIVTTAIMLADGLQGELFLLKVISRFEVGRNQLTQKFQNNSCFDRHASLCFIRRLRILCCLSVLFGFCYWGRHFAYHWTASGSTGSKEGCPSLLRARNRNQYARTISDSRGFDPEPHGWWNHNESVVIGLRNMARY